MIEGALCRRRWRSDELGIGRTTLRGPGPAGRPPAHDEGQAQVRRIELTRGWVPKRACDGGGRRRRAVGGHEGLQPYGLSPTYWRWGSRPPVLHVCQRVLWPYHVH